MKHGTESGGTSREERLDRRAGALLGLAVGDALGATYEFRAPGEVPEEPLEVVGGGWLSLEPGETTDDSALAGCVLEGYAPDGAFSLGPVRDAMIRWLDSEPKDVGNQTHVALDYLRANPTQTRIPDDPEAQGNGAVMRAGAHGAASPGPREAARNAFSEAALTHPSWEARASSALVAALVAVLVAGERDPGEGLEDAYHAVEETTGATGAASLRKVFAPAERLLHDPGGWTVYTTRTALGALLVADGFRDGVESVVRLGGDADTNAAVAGALLGSRFGYSSIPAEWLASLGPLEDRLVSALPG